MKKIASFITALIIFVVIVVVLHYSVKGSLCTNNKSFGTWVNMYKDLSYEAVANNIRKDSMMVFGSSEFNHGKKTKYHPANLFAKKDLELMIVGGAYNQSLTHAIKLGAVENKIKNRKVVIILSPTWFYSPGVSPANFDLRFSESDYMALMENKNISRKTKKYIARRSELLLKGDATMENRVKRYNDIFLEGKDSFWNTSIYKIRKTFIHDRELITVKSAFDAYNVGKKASTSKVNRDEELNWGQLKKDAIISVTRQRTNKYGMTDKIFKRKFKPRLKRTVNSHADDSFARSPEYSDLKCFLDICKETNIDAMVVMQPLNGYWYDHTGLTEDKRKIFNKKIHKIVDEYGIEVADFSNSEYSKYYFQDTVHPSGEGWVKINEEIYKFYKQN